ncbi:MAG TPA: FAD-dependent oxidoreductase [Pseudonocardia sp.]|nr:FAD-dependent oxidoreductase [Pseudonocardia sp.]
MKRVVVVGHGMVGARFVEEVRRRDPDGTRVRLTVLGAEPRPAYNRVLLSTVLAGGLSPEAVQLHPGGWAARQRVDLRTGVPAVRVDRRARLVHTADGAAEPYDHLVLATGSRAWLPPVPGLAGEDGGPGEGIAVFRDLADCERILALARPGARFAVLGGGLLGCEAARGLAGRGVRVTLLHPHAHLMERQLDAGAGAVLAGVLRGLGVELRFGVRAVAVEPGRGIHLTRADAVPDPVSGTVGEAGQADAGTAGRPAGGAPGITARPCPGEGTELVPVDAVVVAAGVRPETALAAEAGIAVGRGVRIDDRLTTSDPRVHALGDCAQHPGTVAGLVQPGWEQAAVLADLLTGADPDARYRGTATVTRLKARDIDLTAVGDRPVADEPGTEVLRLSDPARGRYAALALRDDRVVGGTMIGLPEAAASMVQYFDTGGPAPSDRLALLLGRALPPGATPAADPGHLPAAAVVCRCNTVTKGALVGAWRAGATDPGALCRATRAGTGCGSCRDAVAGICDWLERADPPASDPVAVVLKEGAA